MKVTPAVAGLVIGLLPSVAIAAPTHKAVLAKKSTAAFYQCSKCHVTYTVAQAKQDHDEDPMDGGTPVPVASGTALMRG